MTKGDIVTIFGNPLGLKNPMGQAKLVNPVQIGNTFEVWEVEFPDLEGRLFTKLIRTLKGNKSELILEYERTQEERDSDNGFRN